MTTKAERVVQALRTLGPSTCRDIAQATGISTDEVSGMVREYRRNNKYGLIRLGSTSSHRGTPFKVVAIDEGLYADYMARRAEREANMRPPAPVRKRPAAPARNTPMPLTQFRTQWQPSSPYYQEEA